jgi:hypothetical protein
VTGDPVVDIPVWRVEAEIPRQLTQSELDRLIGYLVNESDRDAIGTRLRTHADRNPYEGEASGELTSSGGARVSWLLGARDGHHARERALRLIGQALGGRNPFLGTDETDAITSTLIMGEVDVRAAFHHHIASALGSLTDSGSSLNAVRGHIEAALVHADELGQETAGLGSSIGDVDALRELMYETSLPLFQRLAEVEAGTRG